MPAGNPELGSVRDIKVTTLMRRASRINWHGSTIQGEEQKKKKGIPFFLVRDKDVPDQYWSGTLRSEKE